MTKLVIGTKEAYEEVAFFDSAAGIGIPEQNYRGVFSGGGGGANRTIKAVVSCRTRPGLIYERSCSVVASVCFVHIQEIKRCRESTHLCWMAGKEAFQVSTNLSYKTMPWRQCTCSQ